MTDLIRAMGVAICFGHALGTGRIAWAIGLGAFIVLELGLAWGERHLERIRRGQP